LLDFFKRPVLTFQEFVLLAVKALRGLFQKPYYWDDLFLQMDSLGIGSLPLSS